jgi:hypothetical protein
MSAVDPVAGCGKGRVDGEYPENTLENRGKNGLFRSKRRLLGLKRGQKWRFSVTDWLTEEKCKPMNKCELEEIKTEKMAPRE